MCVKHELNQSVLAARYREAPARRSLVARDTKQKWHFRTVRSRGYFYQTASFKNCFTLYHHSSQKLQIFQVIFSCKTQQYTYINDSRLHDFDLTLSRYSSSSSTYFRLLIDRGTSAYGAHLILSKYFADMVCINTSKRERISWNSIM